MKNWNKIKIVRASLCKYHPIGLDFIKKYSSEFDSDEWKNISSNKKIKWNWDIIEEYKDKLNWNYLVGSKSIQWNYLKILEYSDILFSKDLIDVTTGFANFPWSYSLIEKFISKWDSYFLYGNSDIPWDEDIIDLIESYSISTSNMMQGHYYSRPHQISSNPGVNWSEEMIDKYDKKGLIYWYGPPGICNHPNLNWDSRLIEKYSEKINNWDGLGANGSIFWDEVLMGKYRDKKDLFIGLSSNKNILWNDDLIDTYLNKWDWERLCRNDSICWSSERIKKYGSRINWVSLSENENVDWNNKIISVLFEQFENLEEERDQEVIFSQLLRNKYFPWDNSLLEKYNKQLDWYLSNNYELMFWPKVLLDQLEVKNQFDYHSLVLNDNFIWNEDFIIENFTNLAPYLSSSEMFYNFLMNKSNLYFKNEIEECLS